MAVSANDNKSVAAGANDHSGRALRAEDARLVGVSAAGGGERGGRGEV